MGAAVTLIAHVHRKIPDHGKLFLFVGDGKKSVILEKYGAAFGNGAGCFVMFLQKLILFGKDKPEFCRFGSVGVILFRHSSYTRCGCLYCFKYDLFLFFREGRERFFKTAFVNTEAVGHLKIHSREHGLQEI